MVYKSNTFSSWYSLVDVWSEIYSNVLTGLWHSSTSGIMTHLIIIQLDVRITYHIGGGGSSSCSSSAFTSVWLLTTLRTMIAYRLQVMVQTTDSRPCCRFNSVHVETLTTLFLDVIRGWKTFVPTDIKSILKWRHWFLLNTESFYQPVAVKGRGVNAVIVQSQSSLWIKKKVSHLFCKVNLYQFFKLLWMSLILLSWINIHFRQHGGSVVSCNITEKSWVWIHDGEIVFFFRCGLFLYF